jgi:hypothetical protein
MLSLLNKSGGDKAATQVLPWRPDFRDVSQLPDTKTVRTDFFINLVVISLTSALALFVAQREWVVWDLRQSLVGVETRIAETKPVSEKAQATYKKFQEEEKKFQEAYALVKEPFRFPDFIIHLGSVLPARVNVKDIEYRGPDQNVLVTGVVQGLDTAANDIASVLVRQLQTDPKLAQHFRLIELANIGRNAEEGTLNLYLVFTFKSNVPKGAKEAAKKK